MPVPSNVGDGISGHNVLPLGSPDHFVSHLFCFSASLPEAGSSAACVVAVRWRVVDVEIHR